MASNMNGTYRHSIDAKGRVAVPAKFRTSLGDRFFVTRGVGGCLFVFSAEEWDRFNEAIRTSLPYREYLKLSRVFNALAADVEPDSQGRVLLPQELRSLAGLKGQAVIIGCSNRAEIWSPENWEGEANAVDDEDVLELLEKMQF